jgi:putative PEP-CTERM system TPR-repeat lipoprotein
LGALGSAYAAADKLNQARTTFERMELVAGADADWQYRIAGYQASTGNWRAAIRCLSKALSAQPNDLPAQVLLSEVYLRSGDSTAAEQRARAVANSHPKRGVGKRLLADIAMVRKNYAEAIAGYQAALKTEPNTEGAIRLFGAYIESGNLAKANEHLEAWVRSNPNDITAMRALAEGYLRADNLSAARAWYEKIAGQAGEQPSILNNLANILLRQRDAKALSYAERAHALSPNDAAVLDTLGWVLVQQGQASAGLRYLREARVRRPNSHEIRYHLAVALNAIGRPDEARSELEPLTTANAEFDGAAHARKLWQHLSKQ